MTASAHGASTQGASTQVASAQSASAHVDTFTRDHLPPRAQWPEFRFTLPELAYPERINCVRELLDRWVAQGDGERACIVSPGGTLTYASVQETVNRIANVLTRDLGMVPGNRVLLRGPNSPMMAAAWLAVIKAGGVAVATMPLLRAKELCYPIEKARIALALCDQRLAEEMEKAKTACEHLTRVVYWNDGGAELESLMRKPGYERFEACDTAAEDICLIAFTSGTTGEPKGTMHNHRDMLATCDSYGRHVLRAEPSDRFIGSPPLAFTFGLGGHLLFPLRIGASTILIEKAPPDELLAAIERFKASVCFTAPTAYRAMLPKLAGRDIRSLRRCVSAGETLPKATFEAWREATGIRILDGIGSTEMLHIFIGSPQEETRAGSTGRVVPGYEARVVDAQGREVPAGTVGRLAVRGPTGCRYLADKRQRKYVENGWNITGDTYVMDDAGYFWYQARSDDMIISAGYNIAGPEVEAALLAHPAVAECGVVGVPDSERGMIVKAYVVLRADHTGDDALTKALQDHVRASIAPYKYPRAIEYVAALPKTQTGKLQRFELRRMAAAAAPALAS
ncbi:MAG TPA: benzoate-CoA ligase family protein [Xanthobacteraceae bacterium]|nr:benzoate-CoA ligase family protein [Xanthobacteraceae bacterium]